jgi:hypothetical protein
MGGRSIIYLIAFRDGATWFITGWEILCDKKAEPIAMVLGMILESCPSPCVLGSDNGREFRGDLCWNTSTQFGIRTWYSLPIHLNATERVNDSGKLWKPQPATLMTKQQSRISFTMTILFGNTAPWKSQHKLTAMGSASSQEN